MVRWGTGYGGWEQRSCRSATALNDSDTGRVLQWRCPCIYPPPKFLSRTVISMLGFEFADSNAASQPHGQVFPSTWPCLPILIPFVLRATVTGFPRVQRGRKSLNIQHSTFTVELPNARRGYCQHNIHRLPTPAPAALAGSRMLRAGSNVTVTVICGQAQLQLRTCLEA